MQNSSLLENSVKTENIFRNYLNKILNTLNVFNTRILLHCIAAIVATFLVSWFQIKPYGVLFIILLVFWVYKTRCAASIKIIPPPELNEKIINVYDKLLKLRKERPAIFCAIITSVLGILAIIGHLLSGSNVVIFGLVLSALVSTKYNFKILKVPNKERLSWVDLTNDNEVDEFLPEVNDSNLFVLQRASDQAVIATATTASSADYADDEKNDEIPSELLLPDSIPEIDENSESSSEDELIPKLSDVNKKKHKNNELTEEIKNLEFKRGYFKKDSSISTSSSSDDESLSKGLNFNEYTVVDGNSNDNQRTNRQNQQQQSVAVISSAAGAAVTILPNLMTGLISSLSKSSGGSGVSNEQTNKKSSDKKQLNAAATAADTSDESDFEILNTEDLNSP